MTRLVTIGEFARMTLLSVKALRHYHEIGLLEPAEVDSDSNYRRYELTQVPAAQVIRRLRELGMSLDDVRAVMRAPDVEARNTAISAHLRRMEGELERTRATVRSLRLLLAESAPPPIAVEYRAVGPQAALAIRHTLHHDDVFEWLDAARAELRAELEASRVARTGPDAALFSSELLEEEHGEIVAILPVASAPEPAGRAQALTLPGVEYAVAVHEGSLDEIDRSYGALGRVVAEREIGVDGAIREDYVVSAFETADEDRHRTEIAWPVFLTSP